MRISATWTVELRSASGRQMRCEPTQWISQWKDGEPASALNPKECIKQSLQRPRKPRTRPTQRTSEAKVFASK